MIALLLALFLPMAAHAGIDPLPADSNAATNKNFKDVDEELRRVASSVDTATATMTTAPNSWTGSQTFNSSATFNGGVFGQISVSSCTLVRTTAVATADLSNGVSTVTLVSNTGRLLAWYTGGVYHASAGVNMGLGLLVNGAFPSGLSTTIAAKSCSNTAVNGAAVSCSLASYPITVTPGSNRFTLTAAAQSGAMTIPPNGGNSTFVEQSYFCVGEYK